jgi:serine/threonine protein kinase/formylglycine-generating enzyme required for sulfatase activity
MSVPGPRELLAFLLEHGFLTPDQVQEVGGAGATRFADARALAAELMERKWLTAYQANKLLPGRGGDLLVGPYRLLDRLGEGGMAQVFRAHHVNMDRVVALKIIPRERLSNPTAVARFYREVKAVAKLSHPNVVTAFEANQAGETHFLAMELVDGIDLAKLVQQSGALPIPQACEYIRQAALGLQHAHERGLVHRDIKPGNLMVTRPSPDEPPVIKILDFGLARFESETAQATRLTQLGKIVGTVDYIAPEQAENAQTADIRADIYGLGCSLFYLLTGNPPFTGKDAVERIGARLLGGPPSVRRSRPEVSRDLENVVAQMMARRPADRYQTPGEVAKALEKCRVMPATGEWWVKPPKERRKVRRPSRSRAEGSATEVSPPTAHLTTETPPSGTATRRAAALSPVPSQPVGQTLESGFTISDALVTRPERQSGWRGTSALAYGCVTCGVALFLGVVLLAGWLVLREETPKPDAAEAPNPDGVATRKEHQAAGGGGEKVPREIINSIGMKLVLIPAGRFMMGSPNEEKDRHIDEEEHEVEITKGFYLGIYEVTQKQYETVMGKNPGWFSNDGGGKDKVKGMNTDEFPVERVSWNDAQAFLNRLSGLEEEQQAGRQYRLPTEAEWEYACRGGATPSTSYHLGGTIVANLANFKDTTLNRTCKVGSYKPNAFGLYDMHGNVWEWCADWYDKDYYGNSPRRDPQGPPPGL